MDARSSHHETRGVGVTTREPLDFDSVYVENFAHVSRWMRAFGAPASDVDDLTQEVFLVVRRKLAGFDGSNLRAWLYRITQRTVSDYRRRSWFRRFYHRSDRVPETLPATDWDPHVLLERKDAERVVSLILSRMSRVRRTAFVLFEIEGYTAPEIAELEGIPVNTVYTRLHHARRDFLGKVAELTGDPMGRVP